MQKDGAFATSDGSSEKEKKQQQHNVAVGECHSASVGQHRGWRSGTREMATAGFFPKINSNFARKTVSLDSSHAGDAVAAQGRGARPSCCRYLRMKFF